MNDSARSIGRQLFSGRLRRDPDFLKLWIGQSVSVAGSQISLLALASPPLSTTSTRSACVKAITPDRLQGRMNATVRTVIWGTIPAGSFVGGILGSSIGVVPTIVIGAAVSTLAAFWILLGPVRLEAQPEAVD